MTYAENTSVAFEKSVAEIITLIKRHGAGQICQFEGDDYEEGYDDGLKACHDIARAALSDAPQAAMDTQP